ncbi:hypothetical protein Vadar_021946 [Vaccinium darrowii]|uniref:Uncharacterized protein n=1 Tax=Vaccinium darrowii TaxID=229202 RepID=A0ACB7Z5J3_9ERIC|nr:hypothetical protein Vadar_021946 [Vaccinium darrowii]
MPSNGKAAVPEEEAEEAKLPLLDYSSATVRSKYEEEDDEDPGLTRRVWIESKKLWHIVGPSMFSRLATYSMFLITQAFAGHLGDRELAAVSIASNVVIGFNFGLLLGMASAFAFQFPLQRFLQSQQKMAAIAWVALAALVMHVAVSWLFMYRLKLDVVGVALTLNFSWWVLVVGLFGYTVCGGCPLTWTGFSTEAFSGLWEFVKLSAASGVMLCVENWYYRVLILMTGNLKNAEVAVDALSICMNINGWEMMIPLAFFAGTGVRVANELGAGNGKGAKFATTVSVMTSVVIGVFFWFLVMIFHNEIALIFSSSKTVLEAVNKLSVLLAFTVLLNSVQPVLSGVAIGSGWQTYVAYINLGCYYLIGVPLGFVMGWVFNQGVMGIWAGMIFGGTAVQTLILAIIVIRCDWEKEAEKATVHVNKWSNRL